MKGYTILISAAFVLLGVSASSAAEWTSPRAYDPDRDYMLEALDDLQSHWDIGPDAKFNRTYYKQLTQCFQKYNDTILIKSQQMSWKGQADYWLTNGTAKDHDGLEDHWGEMRDVWGWNEYKQGKQATIGRYNMTVYEPCNHVSNLAYHHAATKICDYPNWSINEENQRSIKRLLAVLSAQSAFFHGSLTRVGGDYDVEAIALISFLGHHFQTADLPGNSTILKQLNHTALNNTMVEVIENIVISLAEKPPTEWKQVLDDSDYEKNYYVTFGAIICNICSMVFPPSITEPIIKWAANATMPDPFFTNFLVNDYMPEAIDAYKNVQIPLTEKLNIFSMLLGFGIKILYAFLYQERDLLPPSVHKIFMNPMLIHIGAELIPALYVVADWLTGFEQTDSNVNNSVHVYPGQHVCKNEQGHSLWHEVSASGLQDLIYICDFTHRLFHLHNHPEGI